MKTVTVRTYVVCDGENNELTEPTRDYDAMTDMTDEKMTDCVGGNRFKNGADGEAWCR